MTAALSVQKSQGTLSPVLDLGLDICTDSKGNRAVAVKLKLAGLDGNQEVKEDAGF